MCTETPQALPWDPPVGQVGAPGWRQSAEPFCSTVLQPFSLDLFADSRGLFAMASGVGLTLSDDDAGVPGGAPDNPGGITTVPRTQIWLNDGSAWRPQLDELNMVGDFELSGASGAELFLRERENPFLDRLFEGGEELPVPCGVGTFDGQRLACVDVDPLAALSVARADLAHAIMGDRRLLVYDGERWSGAAALLPYPANAIWSDATSVLAAGKVGTAMWLEQGVWSLQDSGTLEQFTALWGPARNDLWAGTAQGSVLHYDGVSWTRVGQLGGVSCGLRLPVVGIWGAGDQVYFHTETQLARWDGTTFESLANWSCTPLTLGAVRLTGLAGMGKDEVFIAISDVTHFESALCGPLFILYFDGTSFHRM